MAWYYHQNGANQGPIEIAALQGLVSGNAISGDTLVWTEGMADWMPYQGSPAATAGAGSGPVATQICAECKKPFREEEMLHYENSWVCAGCKPLFFQRVKEGVAAVGQLQYATIGSRFAAVFVDGCLMGVLLVTLLWPVYAALFTSLAHISPGHPLVQPTFSLGFRLYQYAVSYGLPAAYETFFIGAYGATLGKMLTKVKVVRPDGGRVTYLRAFGRHYAKLLSTIILYIGFIMAFWDDEKRALHDHICSTRVIVNPGP